MATASGLYSDRVKNIMNDRSSTDDRAAAYKESVEIKQQKNKLDKLDETTRVFQAQLLKSTLNSEEHLKHIAKHTKIMAKETMLSQILTLAKYTWFAYKLLKVFKPQILTNTIDRFERFLNRAGFGAKGMQQQCCCDSRGMAGRMSRRGRRMDRRTSSSGGRYEASQRSAERMERSRRATMDRSERIRRNADELRQRKASQIQAKQTQEAINKSMKRWNHSARGSIKGIFDSSGVGLRNSSKAISRAAASSSSNLVKMGLASVAGVAAAMSGIFSTVLGIASRGVGMLAKAGMYAGRGVYGAGAATARIAMSKTGISALSRIGGPAVIGLGAYNMATMDVGQQLKTGKDTGLGNRYVSGIGSNLNSLLFGLPDKFIASQNLGPGSATNLSQLLEDIDHSAGSGIDWLTGLLGYDTKIGRKGIIGAIGNQFQNEAVTMYNRARTFFNPVTKALEDQTEALTGSLDTNFKNMELDHREARKIEYDRLKGLLPGMGDGLGEAGFATSPVLRRPGGYKADADSSSTGYVASPPAGRSTDDRGRRSLFSGDLSIRPGDSKFSQGWSQHDATGFSTRTPEGFSGEAGPYAQRLSMRTVDPTGSSARLGSISAKYEGKVDTVGGDGGRAYGKYQFDYKAGGLQTFFRDNPEYAAKFEGLSPGTKAFNDRWKQVARENPIAFEAAQDRSAKNIWYEPARKHAESLGFKTSDRGIQEALFSGSIQHGGIKKILDRTAALEGFADMTEQQQIQAFYDQRAKYIDTDTRLTGDRRSGVLNRYKNEVKDALALSGQSGPTAFPTIASTAPNIGLAAALPEVTGGSAAQIAIDMNNRGVRNQDITSDMKNIIQYAGGQAGISRISVTSGGQDPASKKNARRTGRSKNHDHGNAADFDMFVTNPDGTERQLRYSNLEDRKIIENFVEHAFKAGATNVGVGPGYMADGRIHLGNTGADGRVWGKTMEYGSRERNIEAAMERGRSQRAGFDLASALSPSSGMAPIPVEIASISPKTHEEAVAHYSQSSGLGSIFGINKAAASELPDHLKGSQSSAKGNRLGSGLYANSASGAIVEDRINQAHQATTAHVAAEKIRPNVNPEASIANASTGITIPSSVDFSQNVPTVNTQPPENPMGGNSGASLSNIPHYADPELMYPLLYHHMNN